MANQRYVCEQACQLGGKRYEVGEALADGVEPNSHFRDTKTGEMVKASQLKSEPISFENKVDTTAELVACKKELVAVDKKLEDFKNLVGEHLAKFDKRIAALETAKKAATAAKSKSDTKEPEVKDERPDNKDGSSPEGNEQPDIPVKN